MSGWDDASRVLAEGLSWLRSREAAIGAGSIDLGQALMVAIIELDSDADIDYDDDSATHTGELQKLEQLEQSLLGDSGLITQIRQSPDLALADGSEL